MKDKIKKPVRITEKLVCMGIGLAALWWVLESFIHVFVFNDRTLIEQLLRPDPHELWMRSLFASLLVIFSILAQSIINSRRRAEEATKQANKELYQIFETAADGMRVIDTDLNVLRLNETFLRMSGTNKDDAINKKCYEVFHGPLCHTPSCPLTRILGGEERVECDVEKKRNDGTIVFCIVTATAFRGPGGELIGIVEDFKDITERKRAEEMLRVASRTAEDERLKAEAIIESIGESIGIIDTDFRFVYQNKVHRDSYGEHIGELCYKAIKNTDKICEGCQLVECFRDGNIHTKERIVPRGEGQLYVVNTASPLRDSTGTIIAGVEIVRDITQLKLAEEALRKNEEKLDAMLRSIVDHMSMMDKDLNIIWANETAMKLFGYDIIGKKCFEAYHKRKEPCEPYPCLTLKAFQDGKVHEHDTQVIDKDGKIMYFHCTANVALRDNKGKPTAVIEISRDTTASKRAEEEKEKLEAQLLQAQKMEAIGTLAGGISHDFNNILQAIAGYTQLLLMQKGVNDPEFSYLNRIDKSVQRANELTKQLLVFSRKVESKLRPVDLNQEVIQVHDVLKRTIPKMIDIELNLAEDPKLINADPVQLEQIMMNLGVNAKDAMSDGGKLIYETRNMILDEAYCQAHLGATPGEYVMLTISDTGHGMDKDTAQHIFEPFYTTKETGKGTGLGLAMVYGIVKSHGGYIMCYSEPGHGTVFRIYFPVLELGSREKIAESKEEEKIISGSETILLVDDEEPLLELGQDMLQQYGYTSIIAKSGEKGIETYKLEKDRIDLVILDIGMPGMGGHKCLQELLKIDPEIKVIISSGYPKDEKVNEMLESGAAGFIGKPYRLKEMLKKVREILDGK